MIRLCFQVDYALSERIADSAQPRFHSLSRSIWFDVPSGPTPCGFTPFWVISDWLFNTLVPVSPRSRSVDELGMFRLSKYGVRAYIYLRTWLLWYPDAPLHPYPCDYSLIFYFRSIYSILYILHTLSREIQVPTSPHHRKSIRNSI